MGKGVLAIDHIGRFAPEKPVDPDSLQYLQTKFAFTFPPIIEHRDSAVPNTRNSRKRRI